MLKKRVLFSFAVFFLSSTIILFYSIGHHKESLYLKRRTTDRSLRTNTSFTNKGACSMVVPRLALVIPYRPRDELEEVRLAEFINFMHSFFSRQPHQICYRIFVIEQVSGKPFNRGKLINVGFLLSYEFYDYFVFHDLDERPWNTVDYSYSDVPTHMMTARSRYLYVPVTMEKDPYYTGGVMKISTEDFLRVNGFSNHFWGWGHEDRDFGFRIYKSGLIMQRLPASVGRFISTVEKNHGVRDKTLVNQNRDKVNQWDSLEDGLTFTRFIVERENHLQNYSHFVVRI